jgi:hypothetical protein
MPVDAEMYRELFGVEGIRAENAFFKKYSIKEEIGNCPNSETLLEIDLEIEKRYAAMEVAPYEYPVPMRQD